MKICTLKIFWYILNCLPPFCVVCQDLLQPSIVPFQLAISLRDGFEQPIYTYEEKIETVEPPSSVCENGK